MRSRNERLSLKTRSTTCSKNVESRKRSAHLIRAQEHTRRISLGANDKLTQTRSTYRIQSRPKETPYRNAKRYIVHIQRQLAMRMVASTKQATFLCGSQLSFNKTSINLCNRLRSAIKQNVSADLC